MYTYKRFDKSVGGSGFFTQIGKMIRRPTGLKKIRTESGLYKTFSRAERGKQFRLFPWRTRSSKNLTGRMNYMNQRIAGKRQKVEGYATKLEIKRIEHHSALDKINTKYADKIKAAQGNPTLVANLQRQQKEAGANAKRAFDFQAKKLTKKVTAAQARLTKKLNKYSKKQLKYKKIMDKKIYKSKKRLEKGFTKTCKNITKTPSGKGKSPLACLQAYTACKQKSGVDLHALTSCVNTESASKGFPLDLEASAVTGTMTKLANKHFIRRFKRARHLREIERLSSGTGAKMTEAYDESKKTLFSGRHLTAQGTNLNKIGVLSKDRLHADYYKSMPANYSAVTKATPGLSKASYSTKSPLTENITLEPIKSFGIVNSKLLSKLKKRDNLHLKAAGIQKTIQRHDTRIKKLPAGTEKDYHEYQKRMWEKDLEHIQAKQAKLNGKLTKYNPLEKGTGTGQVTPPAPAAATSAATQVHAPGTPAAQVHAPVTPTAQVHAPGTPAATQVHAPVTPGASAAHSPAATQVHAPGTPAAVTKTPAPGIPVPGTPEAEAARVAAAKAAKAARRVANKEKSAAYLKAEADAKATEAEAKAAQAAATPAGRKEAFTTAETQKIEAQKKLEDAQKAQEAALKAEDPAALQKAFNQKTAATQQIAMAHQSASVAKVNVQQTLSVLKKQGPQLKKQFSNTEQSIAALQKKINTGKLSGTKLDNTQLELLRQKSHLKTITEQQQKLKNNINLLPIIEPDKKSRGQRAKEIASGVGKVVVNSLKFWR
jgi:hypothetical protein